MSAIVQPFVGDGSKIRKIPGHVNRGFSISDFEGDFLCRLDETGFHPVGIAHVSAHDPLPASVVSIHREPDALAFDLQALDDLHGIRVVRLGILQPFLPVLALRLNPIQPSLRARVVQRMAVDIQFLVVGHSLGMGHLDEGRRDMLRDLLSHVGVFHLPENPEPACTLGTGKHLGISLSVVVLEVPQKHLSSLFRGLIDSRGTDTSPPCYIQDTE